MLKTMLASKAAAPLVSVALVVVGVLVFGIYPEETRAFCEQVGSR